MMSDPLWTDINEFIKNKLNGLERVEITFP
jgi:hypothetical protein